MRLRHYILILLILALAGHLAFLFFHHRYLRGALSASFWTNLGRVGYVMLLTKDQYVQAENLDYDTLRNNAINGMIGGLDGHSHYLSDQELDNLEISVNQRYAGIGTEVRVLQDAVTIMQVYPNSPAEEAGLRTGDRIVEIDGENVSEEPLRELVQRLRGPAETSVEVGVLRGPSDEILRKQLTRRTIDFETIRNIHLLNDIVGYLRIESFGDRTPFELENALRRLENEGAEALILDLRNNVGGLLRSSLAMADQFVPMGDSLLSVQGRGGRTLREYNAETGIRYFKNAPIAVLQNRFSASASEILAGILQAKGRASIFGEISTGKGSVQSLYSFANGEGISLTIALYTLPDGRIIDKEGIEPDLEVITNEEDIIRLSIQGRHQWGQSEEEFEKMFGFYPIEDTSLEAALIWLDSQLNKAPSQEEPDTP